MKPPGRPPHRRLLFLVAAACSLPGPWAASAHAQTWQSITTKAGEPWSDGTKWSGGVAPANDGTANVVFSQSNSTNIAYLDANWNVAGVLFNSTPGLGANSNSTPSIGNASGVAPTLTIQQSGITNASSYAITINPALAVAQAQTWNTGSGGLVVNKVSGTGAITKTGAGKLTFASAQNTATGGLDAAGGTVVATGGGASLGADGSSVTLRNAAVLSFSNSVASGTPYDLTSNHPLTVGSGGGTLSMFDGYVTLAGSITGVGTLTLAPDTAFGSSTVCGYRFGGVNTYSGGTVVAGGVTATVYNNAQALGTGDVTVQAGGVLALASAGNLGPGSRVVLQNNAGTKAAAALVLADPAVATGGIVSAASTGGVIAISSSAWTTPLDFSTLGNGKLSLGASSQIARYSAASLGPGSDGVHRLGGGAVGGTLTIDGYDNVLTGARSLIVGQAGIATYDSISSGSSGNTFVYLARANNFTGGTTIQSGTLYMGSDGSLGSGTIRLTGGTLQATGSARTIANPLSIQYGGLSATDLTFTGPVDLGGSTGTLLNGGQSRGTITFTNVISNGALALYGNTYVLGAVNTFAGGLMLSNATALFASDANLGAPGGTLTLSGGSLKPTVPALTINRPVACSGGFPYIDTNGGAVTLNGLVTTGANVNLTKQGAGTLILTNPANTGSLLVYAGTLQIDTSMTGNSGGGSAVVVNYGGTLAGTGFVGYTSVTNGRLAPGDNGLGTLTVNSGLSLFDGTVLDFDLGTQAADQLVIAGHVFEVSASKPLVVNIANAGGLAPGQTYNLINWGSIVPRGVTAASFQLGTSPVNGTFFVTADGFLRFTTAAYTPFQQWQATYFGSINNAAAAPTANPAGDGISNLLKYALGLDPTRVATAGLPTVGRLPGYLTLTYTRPKTVTDIIYTPQFSDDLLTWNSGITQEILADDGTTQTVLAKVSSDGVTRRFIRLMVASQ